MEVPFVDLKSRFAPWRTAFHAALDRVIDHGQAILGAEVKTFERAVAGFVGCRHAVAVANGTDALTLILRANRIGPGDEVITTPMSYLASTSSIVLAGATPVFADVGDDLNLDPDAVAARITPRTKAIQLVHLAGIPAQVDRYADIARRHDLILIEDCAQAFGARIGGRAVGSLGDFGAVSFHPLKNLGTLGDAGMILTDDDVATAWLRKARNHGHSGRDQCEFWSVNSRLDALQAAFLGAMLPGLTAFFEQRRRQAERYRAGLKACVAFPEIAPGSEPTFNMFMILVERRDALQAHLAQQGIETRVHYPLPIHRLQAASKWVSTPLPRAEYFSQRILSLPIGIHLADEQLDFVIDRIVNFTKAS